MEEKKEKDYLKQIEELKGQVRLYKEAFCFLQKKKLDDDVLAPFFTAIGKDPFWGTKSVQEFVNNINGKISHHFKRYSSFESDLKGLLKYYKDDEYYTELLTKRPCAWIDGWMVLANGAMFYNSECDTKNNYYPYGIDPEDIRDGLLDWLSEISHYGWFDIMCCRSFIAAYPVALAWAKIFNDPYRVDAAKGINVQLPASIEDPWLDMVTYDNVVNNIAKEDTIEAVTILRYHYQSLLPMYMHNHFYRDIMKARKELYKDIDNIKTPTYKYHFKNILYITDHEDKLAKAKSILNDCIRDIIEHSAGPASAKNLLLPYKAAIEESALPATWSVDYFNKSFNTNISKASFSEWISHDKYTDKELETYRKLFRDL